jgi:hypothetical protein
MQPALDFSDAYEIERILLGRAEQSSPNRAWRRAEGAGRAIINLDLMRVIFGHCPKDQVPGFYKSFPSVQRILCFVCVSIRQQVRRLHVFHQDVVFQHQTV